MKKNSGNNFFFVLVAITATLITAIALKYKAGWMVVIPLYISMCSMFLQSKVNKYAYLVGGTNSILYGAADIYNTLYTSAANCLLISFPMQILTFFKWKKNSQNGNVIFKKLTLKSGLLLALIYLAGWLTLYMVFSVFGSKYILLDSIATVTSITSTFLCILRFREYVFFQISSVLMSTATYISMLPERPMQLAYVVYNIYALLCIFKATLTIYRMTILQKPKISR